MKFGANCPLCSRSIVAATMLVLHQKCREHFEACRKRAAAAATKRDAEHAQVSMFIVEGGDAM